MSHPFNRTELAPMLRVFGDHAGRMSLLVRLRPSLLPRITFAPRRAIHAIGCWFHLSPEAAEPDAYVAEVVEKTHPRNLLRSAIPHAPARLYRALDGIAEDHVCDLSFYSRLSRILEGPLGELLVSAGRLDETRLAWVETVLRSDPAIHPVASVLPQSSYQIEALDALITFLRTSEAIRQEDFALPREARTKALLRRLQRAVDRLEAPSPGFTLARPYRVIVCIGELRRVGKAMRNCVGGLSLGGSYHWFDLAAGRSVFIVDEQTSVLAALKKVCAGLWYLTEVNGPDNTPIGDGRKEILYDALSNAGVRLLRQEPFRALEILTRQYGNIDDLGDDDEEEAVLA